MKLQTGEGGWRKRAGGVWEGVNAARPTRATHASRVKHREKHRQHWKNKYTERTAKKCFGDRERKPNGVIETIKRGDQAMGMYWTSLLSYLLPVALVSKDNTL